MPPLSYRKTYIQMSHRNSHHKYSRRAKISSRKTSAKTNMAGEEGEEPRARAGRGGPGARAKAKTQKLLAGLGVSNDGTYTS